MAVGAVLVGCGHVGGPSGAATDNAVTLPSATLNSTTVEPENSDGPVNLDELRSPFRCSPHENEDLPEIEGDWMAVSNPPAESLDRPYEGITAAVVEVISVDVRRADVRLLLPGIEDLPTSEIVQEASPLVERRMAVNYRLLEDLGNSNIPETFTALLNEGGEGYENCADVVPQAGSAELVVLVPGVGGDELVVDDHTDRHVYSIIERAGIDHGLLNVWPARNYWHYRWVDYDGTDAKVSVDAMRNKLRE